MGRLASFGGWNAFGSGILHTTNVGPDTFMVGDPSSPYGLNALEAHQLDPTAIGLQNIPTPDELAVVFALIDSLQRGVVPGPPSPYANYYSGTGARLPKRFEPYVYFDVLLPGEIDRGRRRLIVGAGGEYFYTNTHYDHFIPIEVGGP